MENAQFWFLVSVLVISNVIQAVNNYLLWKEIEYIDYYVQNDLKVLYDEVRQLERKERQKIE